MLDTEEGREQETVGTTTQAITGGWSAVDGIMTNGIMTNGIMTNGIMTNGIMTNSLTTDAVTRSFRDAMNDSKARTFIKYAVECALSARQSFTVTNTNGATYTYQGQAGLYTSWLDYGCSSQVCQERITSCLLARTNAKGIKERLSIRHPYAGTVSDTEKQVFKYREAVYMGNLWLDPSTHNEAVLVVAQGEASLYGQVDIDYGFDRYCGGVYSTKTCPIYDVGRIVKELTTAYGNQCGYGNYVCNGTDADGAATSCYHSGFCQATTYVGPQGDYQSAVTSWRPGIAPHSETSSGSALYRTDSLCAWKVSQDVGDTYCQNNYWDSICVAEARQYCGDHDLTSTGASLVRGDMSCINNVCDHDSYCCKANGSWDSICVNEAQSYCGL